MWQAEKMPRKAQSKEKEPGHAEERAGPSDETKEPEEYSYNKMITAISEILDSKLASLATKDDINDLKHFIDQQRLKIEMLEAKIVLMEKYEQRIESLEKRATEYNLDIDAVNERFEQRELRSDDNEQYHRRLCLRINVVELSEGSDGESGPECFQKVQNILKDDLKLDIPDMSIDRAHRIGSVGLCDNRPWHRQKISSNNCSFCDMASRIQGKKSLQKGQNTTWIDA